MNRRGFFSFLPGAAVGVAAAATVKAEAKPAIPPEVVRYDRGGHRCPKCDSPCFHMRTVYEVDSTFIHAGERWVRPTPHRAVRATSRAAFGAGKSGRERCRQRHDHQARREAARGEARPGLSALRDLPLCAVHGLREDGSRSSSATAMGRIVPGVHRHRLRVPNGLPETRTLIASAARSIRSGRTSCASPSSTDGRGRHRDKPCALPRAVMPLLLSRVVV